MSGIGIATSFISSIVNTSLALPQELKREYLSNSGLLKYFIQNNNDIPFDGEEGISIIYIEGQSNDDNDIERRERE